MIPLVFHHAHVLFYSLGFYVQCLYRFQYIFGLAMFLSAFLPLLSGGFGCLAEDLEVFPPLRFFFLPF